MSDAVAVNVPVSLVQGAQPTPVQATSGNTLPPSGKSATPSAATQAAPPAHATAATQNANSVAQKATATNPVSVPALVAQLNKYLNDTGRPNQFRVDPTSGGQTIQEINPSNGHVIGEYAVAEFPALARSLGVSGVLVDSHA
jgi:hypothetical protein